MSEINLENFFTLEGKVALVTGGPFRRENIGSEAISLTYPQALEDLACTRRPHFCLQARRPSSSPHAKSVANKALTKRSLV